MIHRLRVRGSCSRTAAAPPTNSSVRRCATSAARTAEIGRWVPAPGALLFKTLLSDPETQSVNYIAEDLGVITPDVEALRDGFGLPGIRVLQFGFGPDET